MRRFFTATKLRKLDRVAVGYLVTAWVVVQAGSIALPAFEAPPWAMKLLIAGSVVGFPLVLLVAWFWRIGTASEEAGEAEMRPHWGRTEWLVLGLLAFVLITGAVEFALLFGPRTETSQPEPQGAPAAQASIAVLPFANLSGDPEKRYFSEGIADQLISELSKTPALRVASRTSSFAVAQQNMDVRALGKALNVRTVLEGSVREESGRVRIAAQLVNVSDGFEIWSNTYDRNLTDILALQDEIARAITLALTQRLMGRRLEPVTHPKPHPIAPDAYRDYLQAQFFFAQRSLDGINRAIVLLEKVTERAPDFAGGYATLADAHATMAFNFNEQTHVAPALYAVKRALAIDPNNITALAAHATASLVMWKWLNAAEDVRKMHRLAPNNAEVWHNSSIFFAYMGLPDLTLDAAKRAAELDPLSYIDRFNLAIYSLADGDIKNSVAYAREAIALQPGNVEALGTLCEVLSAAGQYDEARQALAKLSTLSLNDTRVGNREACQFWIAVYSGDGKKARAIIESVLPGYPQNGVPAGDVSTAYRVLGDNAKALEWYILALDNREIGVLPMRYFAKGPKDLFAHPAWRAARQRPEVIAWENARTRIAREFGSKRSGS